MHSADLIVIGAGPAGMAAAATAASAGLDVLLLDEQPRAGGQIYRDVTRAAPARGHILGADFADGLPLAQGIESAGISHVTGATVWKIQRRLLLDLKESGISSASVKHEFVFFCVCRGCWTWFSTASS